MYRKLKTRSWERGLTTSYAYNGAGELSAITYSTTTPETPAITYTYDRRGRRVQINHGSNITKCVFNMAGQLLCETNTVGILAGTSVTNSYDRFLRRNSMSVFRKSQTADFSVGFTYDGGSRLSVVNDGTCTATYTYLANSPLVSQINFANSGLARMTTTRQFDFLSRVTGINSIPSGANQVPTSFAFVHNDANQQIRSTLADGSFWAYGYDRLGQVVSGKRYWRDGTPVAGQQYEYSFDDIGNRTTAKWGGDGLGTGLRVASYTNNLANQVTGRGVPAGFDVIGMGNAGATISITAGGTSVADYRKGPYFQEAVTVANANGDVWQKVIVSAVNGGAPNYWPTGSVFIARTNEVIDDLTTPSTNEGYDLDGNQVRDGRWSYTWDAENRLRSMTGHATTPAGSRRKLEFDYDWQGRRIRAVVYTNYANTFTAQITNRFVYDGWNVVAVLNPESAIAQSFVWGLDVSGSEQGAGGVGGLLSVKPGNGTSHFAAYDGNGNVVALVDGAIGGATAGYYSGSYEYGPFGEVIRATGPMAKANPFRFSTKYQDDESDLLYYGYRYYNPSTGRWLSRDPLENPNPYNVVGNNSLSAYDVLGLWGASVHYNKTVEWAVQVKMPGIGASEIAVFDDRVDSDFNPTTFSDANWKWHFDRSGGGKDTRLEMSELELQAAKAACSNPVDDWNAAAIHMGRSLHPLQDWVAHGDFNRKSEAPYIASVGLFEMMSYAHNALTKQSGMGWKSVDDEGLDSDGPDGRATFSVMTFARITSVGDRLYWAKFHGGTQRIRLTESKTKAAVEDFMNHVRLKGRPCGMCQKRFLPAP